MPALDVDVSSEIQKTKFDFGQTSRAAVEINLNHYLGKVNFHKKKIIF